MPSLGREVEQRPRAALLTQVAVFATLFALSTCLTGSHSCPRSLDCARAGRHFCQSGSSHCGPCLSPLVEDLRGRCVVKRRHAHIGKVTTYPELDEEIDFLSTIIGEQQETAKLPAPPPQNAPKPEEEEPNVPGPAQASTSEPSTTQRTLSATTAPPTTTNHTATNHIATNHTTTNNTSGLRNGPVIVPYPSNDHMFIVMSSVFIVVGSLSLMVAGVCWIRLQKGVRLAQKMDYPAYGIMGAHSYDNTVPGDKKLAHSAQMYHYQHQKQQMLSLEKHRDEPKVSDSGATSDEENEDGDFTVYECPGLAPTGEMEVKNPLFDDSTLYLQRFHK